MLLVLGLSQLERWASRAHLRSALENVTFAAFPELGCKVWKYLISCFKAQAGHMYSSILKRAFLEATLSLALHAASSAVAASNK